MRLTTCLTTALLLVSTGATATADAQEAGALPRVLQIPASTRAVALGDAFVTTSGHADAIFYHPALLAGAAGFGLEVQRWGTASDATAASAAVSWFGGTVGIGLQTLQYGSDATGSLVAPAGADHLFTAGATAVSETAATLGYAYQVFGIDLGASAKLVEQRIGTGRGSTMLFDVGVQRDVGPMTAALSYQNFGSGATVGGTELDTPERLTLGIGFYGLDVSWMDLGVSAAVSRVGEEIVPGGGVEVGYWPVVGRTFVARVGARRIVEGEMSPFSFGFAFWGDDVTLEWAFHPSEGDDAGTHRFGVRWR